MFERRKWLSRMPIDELVAFAQARLDEDDTITVYWMCDGREIRSVPNPFRRITKLMEDMLDGIVGTLIPSLTDFGDTVNRIMAAAGVDCAL